MTVLIIPFQQLESDVLQALLQEYVSRDGTDYGAIEISLDEKVSQLMAQLREQELVLCFDPASESCDLLQPQEAERLQAAMALQAEYDG